MTFSSAPSGALSILSFSASCVSVSDGGLNVCLCLMGWSQWFRTLFPHQRPDKDGETPVACQVHLDSSIGAWSESECAVSLSFECIAEALSGRLRVTQNTSCRSKDEGITQPFGEQFHMPSICVLKALPPRQYRQKDIEHRRG